MPTPCCCCDKIVELNDMRSSKIWSRYLVCDSCARIHDRVHRLRNERRDLKDDLANQAEYMKGKRSEYRKKIYSLEKEIIDLGYDVE